MGYSVNSPDPARSTTSSLTPGPISGAEVVRAQELWVEKSVRGMMAVQQGSPVIPGCRISSREKGQPN